MPEKLEDVPPAWKKLHEQSAGALLRAESRALGLLQRAVRQEVAAVVLELVSLPPRSDARFVRRRAIFAIRSATGRLAARVEEAILQGRRLGRVAAYEQLLRELRQVRRELVVAGIPEHEHPGDPPDPRTSDETDVDAEDRSSAHAVGTTFAGAWASRTLRLVLRWEDTEEGNLPALVRATIESTDAKVRQIAATETARAFADEHDDGAEWIAQENDEATWIGALFKFWNALNDKKVCPVCRDHDGEIALVGMSFRGGDVPGEVHTSCRCSPSFAFLPWRLAPREPEEQFVEDDEQAA